MIRPRQTAEPVLYVGSHTAWRVSPYNDAGRVVAFVPAEIDLSRDPVWFGTPELPERVDTVTIQRELAMARSAGIRPFDARTVDAAVERGGEVVSFETKTELLHSLHELVLEFIAR